MRENSIPSTKKLRSDGRMYLIFSITLVAVLGVASLTPAFPEIAFIIYFIVCLMMPVIHQLYLYLVPVVLFGIAQGMNLPSLQILLVRLAPPNQRALFLSINGMVLRIGQTIGPLLIGVAYAFSGISGAFFLAALVAASMFIITVLVFSTRKE